VGAALQAGVLGLFAQFSVLWVLKVSSSAGSKVWALHDREVKSYTSQVRFLVVLAVSNFGHVVKHNEKTANCTNPKGKA
jgi:hypothetical protein